MECAGPCLLCLISNAELNQFMDIIIVLIILFGHENTRRSGQIRKLRANSAGKKQLNGLALFASLRAPED